MEQHELPPQVSSLDQLQINIGETAAQGGDHIDIAPIFEPARDIHTALARSGASARYQMALVREIIRNKQVDESEIPLLLANAVTGADARTRTEFTSTATAFGSHRDNRVQLPQPYEGSGQ